MAEEIAQLKQLQAGMNAAFDSLFKSTQENPNDNRAITAAKEQIATMAQMTFGTVLGPVFSIIGLSMQSHAYAAVRIAIDLKLFEFINKSTSLDEIVEKTNGDPVILQRILRGIGSIGYIKQTAPKQWEPTPLTQTLKIPSIRDWLVFHFDQHLAIAAKFPEWLKKHEYKTTGAAEDNVLTEVLGASFPVWLQNNPESAAVASSAMAIQESFPKEMVPPYPFSGDIGEIRTDPDAVTLVDIGGGFGQAIKSLHADYPNINGRFIVQDLPEIIGQINASQAEKEGFEPMAYNFFNQQTIKGAKYYHLRRVLHDWNDESSIKILEATHAAMKDTPNYSKLLIHEFVLPDVGCGFSEAMIDLIMLEIGDGKERTELQWHELLRKTGFNIVKIWRADQGATAVIEAVIA